ncbi:NF-kappa-B inhibitor cactus isoform X2 [Anoplophora glabripennis]|nr:NF-kappa-B inhibitor cactus isoform X2 [Anoplophora glabripennis]XP_018578963.1 NF-kappa-B inhibitor cactus isoform X2 [Anoplophora glabripennis]
MQPTSENAADSGTAREKGGDSISADLDSCIFESFSNMSINDLSDRESSVEFCERSKLEPQEHVAKAPDISWKIFYQQDDDGDTYLHIAIAEGFVDVALALIRAVPHPRLLDTPNDDAQTPLHLAVKTAQWRVARWLVVAGARPCPRDLQGDSPLHVAARLGDVKSVKAIADPVKKQEKDTLAFNSKGYKYQCCNLDQWNYLGETCVHVAALQGHVEVLRQLLWYGADINAREGRTGYTALHYAVERGDEAAVQFLLQCEGLDSEIETYGGLTAFEIDPLLPTGISKALKKRGVTFSFFSDGDDDDTDSEYSGD